MTRAHSISHFPHSMSVKYVRKRLLLHMHHPLISVSVHRPPNVDPGQWVLAHVGRKWTMNVRFCIIVSRCSSRYRHLIASATIIHGLIPRVCMKAIDIDWSTGPSFMIQRPRAVRMMVSAKAVQTMHKFKVEVHHLRLHPSC